MGSTSDILSNEATLPSGQIYQRGDWESYCIHDNDQVFGFFGKYRFLSNFHDCPVSYEGVIYSSSERAYQAAKWLPAYRSQIAAMTNGKAKRAHLKAKPDMLVEGWLDKRLSVMREVTFSKYLVNLDLRAWLVETDKRRLVEANHWHDSFYGHDIHIGSGENNLGLILEDTRAYWQSR